LQKWDAPLYASALPEQIQAFVLAVEPMIILFTDGLSLLPANRLKHFLEHF
jgi:hypothetical protein